MNTILEARFLGTFSEPEEEQCNMSVYLELIYVDVPCRVIIEFLKECDLHQI